MAERPHDRVIVVMPAHNAALTLERTVSGIPTDWVDEVILVDDKSTDNTVALARELPLHVIWHPHNVGYGGNQKTCYLEALQRNADVVVMLHPDGQYEPELIPDMVEPILRGEADLVLGSRLFLRNALDFSFDSELLMQAVHFDYRIAEVPVRTRYFADASSTSLQAATVYGLKTLVAAGRLVLHRAGILRSREFQP